MSFRIDRDEMQLRFGDFGGTFNGAVARDRFAGDRGAARAAGQGEEADGGQEFSWVHQGLTDQE
ncbi:hypothetical protein GCM10022223_10560 [Kineosporia mesophila]|uniref:Uncharacterized protein n=1 Tax=Kineosporia mesophila TaxID=566012 RepID=A0ABP6Z8G1_9ACTN|nr:hypothetical protein [Kineosporia mesophila]MCD5352535.1 hypothetical protein [Kineosporia mesophila]